MNITLLDPLGAAISLTCVYYSTKAQARAWILGLIALLINAWLYYQKGIYGHLMRDCLYFFLMFFGLYSWLFGGKNKTPLPISTLSFKKGLFLGGCTVLGICITSYFLKHFTTSQIPYWDATTTSLALVAQWLLCRKIIACWAVWFVADALTVGLHFYQGIPFHSAIHAIYLFLAVLGYLRWKKKMDPIPQDYSRAI